METLPDQSPLAAESQSLEKQVNCFENNESNKCNSSTQDFTVIWHNLTYKVDSRRWVSSIANRLFNPTSENNSSSDVASIFGTNDNETIGGNKERTILDQVCGYVESKQLTAILGPSGAGKSSLLYCLFQNRSVGVTGHILVESRTKSKLKVCFIPQNDYLNEWLTVREDLIFVSKLKLARITSFVRDDSNSSLGASLNHDKPTESDSYVKQAKGDYRTSLIDHEANALRVADLLGLVNCLDVRIRNISGGQKKRLSVARELMSKPDILILDEPTTGLDSLTCYKTIKVLKDLARLSPNPMAVVITIHQPEKSVFNLFDKTYILSNTGRIIYDGHPRGAIQTIQETTQIDLPKSSTYNPASYLIEIASIKKQSNVIDQLSNNQRTKFFERYPISHLDSLKRTKSNNTSQNWRIFSSDKQPFNHQNDAPSTQDGSYNLHVFVEPTEDNNTMVKSYTTDSMVSTDDYYISHQLSNCLSSHSSTVLESFRHVFILTHRSWLSVIRNPAFTRSRFAFHVILPLFMLVVFGTRFGSPNNCPKLGGDITIRDLTDNINSGLIAKTVDESRLCVENMSFFFLLMYGFGINLISCTASFYPLTMHMFKKERINGLYSTSSYFIGQMLAELPLEIFLPSISILLSYPLSGQLPSFLEWRMFAIAYVIFLVCYTTHALGLLCGAIAVKNVNGAVLLGQAMLLPFVMLSGFLIRPARMSDWMKKFSFLSPYKHGLNAIVAARYGFGVCECDEDLLPGPEGTLGISGLTPNVRHVIEYMFPKNSTQVTGGNGTGLGVIEIFEKLAKRYNEVQTFSIDVKSCNDVQPFLMHVLGVKDVDMFFSIGYLILCIIVMKSMTYYLLKSFPYRID